MRNNKSFYNGICEAHSMVSAVESIMKITEERSLIIENSASSLDEYCGKNKSFLILFLGIDKEMID